MAEIKIEKKSPIWPWIILGILLVGLLLYFLVFKNNDSNVIGADNDTSTQVTNNQINTTTNEGAGGNAVTQYVDYINSERMMTLDHEYTNGALLHLANAIQEKASNVGYDVRADLDRVKTIADDITQNPMAETHANKINNAAGILTTAMENMQQAKFPNLQNEVNEVKEAMNSLKPDVLTLDQKDAVKTFFDKSSQLLQKMN